MMKKFLTRIAVAGVLVLGGWHSMAPAAPNLAIFRDTWQPDPYTAIATVGGEAIDEQDVYLWLELTGGDPLLVRDWKSPANALDASSALETTVRSMLESRILSEMPEAAEFESTVSLDKARRILAAPAAFMLFGEKLVKPRVQISAMDVAQYYRQHEDLYAAPERAVVRRLRVPIEDIVDLEQINDARRLAEQYREEAMEKGGLYAILQKHQELLLEPSAGATFTVRRGQGDVDERIEEEVFGLLTNQISRPIETRAGIFVYEVISRSESNHRPLGEVEDEIRSVLLPRFYAQQFDLELQKAIKNAYPMNRAEYFHALEPEMEVATVRGWSMTKGEFLELYPEFRNKAVGRTPTALVKKVKDLIRAEVAAQELGAFGLLDEPEYENALELAEQMILARQTIKTRLASINPTDEQLDQYINLHRDELAPTSDRTIWKLVSRSENPRGLTRAQQTALVAEMLSFQQEKVAEAIRLINDRVSVSGPSAFVYPEQVVRRLLPTEAAEFTTNFDMAGIFTAHEAREQLGLDFGAYQIGQFTPPKRELDGSVVTYYVAEERARPEPDTAEVRERAREMLIENATRLPARKRVQELEESGKLVWKF